MTTPKEQAAQPEALRLADAIEGDAKAPWTRQDIAAELRRQHAEIESLRAQAAERAVPAETTVNRAAVMQWFDAHGNWATYAQLASLFQAAPAQPAPPVAAAGGVVSDWRDQVLRLAQFADTATRMSAKDMHNNMETLADELTKLLAAAPQPPAPAATADALDAARYRWLLEQAWFQSAFERYDISDDDTIQGFAKECARVIDAAMAAQRGTA